MCPFRHISGEKTVVCKHWLRGLCKKGDQCEFLHEYDMTKMPECYFYSKFGKGHCSSYLAFLASVGVWWRGSWCILLVLSSELCSSSEFFWVLLGWSFSDLVSASSHAPKSTMHCRCLLSQELVPWGKRGEVQSCFWVLFFIFCFGYELSRLSRWSLHDSCFGELMSSRGHGGAKLLCTCFPALEIWT